MRNLVISLTIIFGWLPGLALALFALFWLKEIWLNSTDFSFITVLVLLWGLGGLLGFWALSSVAIGIKLNFFLRFVFLIVGVLAAILAEVVFFAEGLMFASENTGASMLLLLILNGPILCGLTHIYYHYCYMKQTA
ncbi:hypothetical protein [Neptunicella marina]|uniref:Uncharacterized protein n=1 Tax=Neptunicella marina TaxID=2125989 RepID=A0A8J6IUG0_9ALTE|nr:hypothetical protein [Neptunicella marina]MBC3766050.1 hypothetical protein [Neptunicella marina]